MLNDRGEIVMNYKGLKDVKVITGFIASMILPLIAVALAANDNDFWVFFVFISFVVLSFSVSRANKIYKEDKDD